MENTNGDDLLWLLPRLPSAQATISGWFPTVSFINATFFVDSSWKDSGRYNCYEYGENGILTMKKVYSAHPGICDPSEIFYYDDVGRVVRWVSGEETYSASDGKMVRKEYNSRGQVLCEETYKEQAGQWKLSVRHTNYSEGGYRVDHYEADHIKSSDIIRSDGTRGRILYEHKDGILIREWYEGNLGGGAKTEKYIVYTYDAEAKTKTESHYGPNGKLIQEITVDWEPEK